MTLSFKQFNTVLGLAILTMAFLQLIAWYFSDSGLGMGLLFASFWSPLFVCLLAGKATRQEVKKALRFPKAKWLMLSVLMGLGLLLADQIVLYLWNLGLQNSDVFSFDTQKKQVWISNAALILGIQPQGYAFFALNLSLSLVVTGILTAIFIVIGFEVCWRTIIYRQLGALLGMHKAPFFIGLLIAVSFIPLHLTGFLNSESPYLTAFILNPIICIASSYVLASFASQQTSAWPSAFVISIYAIGTQNLFLVPENETANLIAKAIVLVIVALWINNSLKSRFEHQALISE
jgi:hypothetical protein